MRHLVLACLVLLALPQPAGAKSHLWKFTEVFSNADGSVQFIEMFVFDPAGTGEWVIQGQRLASDANVFIFPNNLPMENTFERWLLIATPAFAALPDAPTPDFIIPPQFFDPAEDELRYRTALDILPLPPGAVPLDGIQSYRRNGTTAVNSPINFAGETTTLDLTRPCANAADDDGDGLTDLDDPACRDADWTSEHAQCQDGLDNDLATGTDFDGGESIHGPGGVDPEGADPHCVGTPWRDRETPRQSCGLGPEPAGVLLLAWAAARSRRRRRG